MMWISRRKCSSALWLPLQPFLEHLDDHLAIGVCLVGRGTRYSCRLHREGGQPCIFRGEPGPTPRNKPHYRPPVRAGNSRPHLNIRSRMADVPPPPDSFAVKIDAARIPCHPATLRRPGRAGVVLPSPPEFVSIHAWTKSARRLPAPTLPPSPKQRSIWRSPTRRSTSATTTTFITTASRVRSYLAWTERWLAAVRRVLKPTGSFYVAIGDEYVAESEGTSRWALGLTMHWRWIVWHYTFGVHCKKKFTRSHAHILYYVVDPKRFTFDADAVRVPSARQTTYADRRAKPSRRSCSDDTWVLRPQERMRVVSRQTATPGTSRRLPARSRRRPATPVKCRRPCWNASSACRAMPATWYSIRS